MEILSHLFTYIVGPVVGGVIGWFLGRPKQKVEVESGELDNVDKAIEIYRKMIKDLEAWKTELLQKMQAIDAENQMLRDQLQQERRENGSMRKRISQLEHEISELKKLQ